MRIIEPAIERIVDAGNLCGETAVWHAGEAALYWVDCDGHELEGRWHGRLTFARRENRRHPVGLGLEFQRPARQ